MKFITFAIADISTRYITQRDAEILSDPTCPGRLAALDGIERERDSPGVILSVGNSADDADRTDEYKRRGLSSAFIGLMEQLSQKEIPYVRFDRDGSYVEGAEAFD